MTPESSENKAPREREEGGNASVVGGKICRGQATADEAAYSKKACQNQRAMQAAKEGVISGTIKTSKSSKSKGSGGRQGGPKC